MVRIRSLQEKPDPKLIPKAVLQVGEDQKNVLVVDTTRSRMYVYENQGGELKFQNDFYISQGRFGANKTKSGDQRTPIGVLREQSHPRPQAARFLWHRRPAAVLSQ
jgi:murein L,D-transpeptidase YafK